MYSVRFTILRLFSVLFLLLFVVPLVRADEPEDEVESGRSSKRAPMQVPDASDNWYYDRVLAPIRWEPDSGPITRLEIRLSEEKVYAYQGENLVGSSPVSTGKPGYRTPPGNYTVLMKDLAHKSSQYGVFVDGNGKTVISSAEPGDAVPAGLHYEPSAMPFYMRITDGGIGLHSGFVTGTPISHGCIRLPASFAEDLYSIVRVGTPVKVVP